LTHITNQEQLQNSINTGNPVLIYFSGENCSVCKVLKPKIEEEIKQNFPKMKICEVQTDLYKELTAYFMVFSLPTILVYFDKKEFKRYGRNMSVPLFIEEIKRPYDLMCE
jgi:thioredoxin-like negative regulator of GroEL